MAVKKHTIKKWLHPIFWSLVGIGTVALLVAAIRIKDAQRCKGVRINIKGVNNIFFIDKKDVMDSIISIEGFNPVGQPVASFNLRAMEGKLTNNIWIRNAQLFFDNNGELQVDIVESEPLARLFTTSGATFYIDSALNRLPLSDKFSARIPVFTSFPSDKKRLSPADSSLLRDIKTVSLAIQEDPFYMALIEQTDITPERNFEMFPKIGNNIIEFGDADNAGEKLKRLKLFYKEVMLKAGMNYYSVIDVQYKGQVVARRKSAADVTADSLKTVELMQLIAANAEKQSADSAQLQPDNEEDQHTDAEMAPPVEQDESDSSDVIASHLNDAEQKPVKDTAAGKEARSLPLKPPAIRPVLPKPPENKKPVAKPVEHKKPVVNEKVKAAGKAVQPALPAKPDNDY